MRTAQLLVSALFATLATASHATVLNVVTNTAAVDTVPGLTGYATSGAQMSGLQVTANFSGGFSQTLAWATTGATAGGVSGTGWGLSIAGDTYSSLFNFRIDSGRGQLQTLVLNAAGPNQITIFDTDFGGREGTPGSASGHTFSIASGCAQCVITANYTNAVAITGKPAVGDLFHTLSLSFADTSGPTGAFAFRQDVDNDVRLNTRAVPEPGALPLVGLGLVGMAALARRRRRQP